MRLLGEESALRASKTRLQVKKTRSLQGCTHCVRTGLHHRRKKGCGRTKANAGGRFYAAGSSKTSVARSSLTGERTKISSATYRRTGFQRYSASVRISVGTGTIHISGCFPYRKHHTTTAAVVGYRTTAVAFPLALCCRQSFYHVEVGGLAGSAFPGSRHSTYMHALNDPRKKA